jgi:Kef-type K+ transport system membrane component KefB
MGLVRAFVPVALGLTTTALGTLLPILRDNNMLRGSFGSYLLAGGAVGEFFPIVAIAIFLGSNGRFLGLMSLLAVAVIALVLSLIPRLGRGGRLAQILTERTKCHSADHPAVDGGDAPPAAAHCQHIRPRRCLGCILGRSGATSLGAWRCPFLRGKLDAVGYGFFIPIFFVTSGMSLDLHFVWEQADSNC